MKTTALVVVALFLLMVLRRSSGGSSRLGRVLSGVLGGFAVFSAGLAIPLGPSDREVRRRPWVTYGVLGLSAFVFQLQVWVQPGPEWRDDLGVAWHAAIEYAMEHPYLTIPPALEQFAGDEIQERTAQVTGARPQSSDRLAAEQAELERRVEGLLVVLDRDPERRWGYVPARGSWVTALTSMFVHGGWLHLLGNMLVLVLTGPFVEDVFGRTLFAFLYLASGLVGDWATTAASPGSYVVSIGASGAIAGVMGAFLMRFATRRLDFVSIPALWLPLLRARVSVPAYLYLLPWLGQNFLSARLGVPGVGWHAHIGGFLFGVLFAAIVRLSMVEERLIHPRIEASISIQQHPAVERAFAHRTAGRLGAARQTLVAALAEAPNDLGLHREAYDVAVAAGDLEVAGEHGARVVELLRPRADRDSIREGYRFINDVRAALDDLPHPHFWWAAGEYLEARCDRARALLFYEMVASGPDRRLARRAVTRKAHLLESCVEGAR